LAVIGVLALAVCAHAGAVRNLPGFSANVYGANDDGSYPCTGPDDGVPANCTPAPVPIGFTLQFYGNQFNQAFINNNGNITFDQPLGDFTPFGLEGVTNQIIAPFFADVDTRLGNLVTFGDDTVNGYPAFGVNWIGVGYYAQEIDKLNSFQLVLINRSDRNPGDFDIEFNYDQIQWETGDASGGADGLGGSSAVVGFSNGSGLPGTSLQLAGSAQPGELLDRNPGGLIHNELNTNVLGRYIFPIVNLTNTVLNVTRFSQDDPKWATNTYDHSALTISNKGCALASLAMVLRYAGISIDPGTLNTLATADNDFVGSSISWDAATRDASSDTLEFHAFRTTSSTYLSQSLANGFPVVVGVNLDTNGSPGHFVVVIGEQNGQFIINDPGHADFTTLDQYNNQFVTRGYVGDPAGDVSGLDVSTGGAASFLLVSPTGQRTGFSPLSGIVQEIPQSVFVSDSVESDDLTGAPGTDTAHEAILFQPPQGTYELFILGNQSGAYNLYVRFFAANGKPAVPVTFQGVTTLGAVTVLQLTVSATSVSLSSTALAPVSLVSLWSFDGPDDGAQPHGGLIQAANGFLYGTTSAGGAHDYGTVFQISTNGILTNLYSFGTVVDSFGLPLDGSYPYGSLVQGADGSLYGTTFSGGVNDLGTVFAITTNGTLTTLYSFGTITDTYGDPLDGSNPYCSLVQGADGSLYGTAESGGANGYLTDFGFGTIFQITTNGALTTLYSFGTLADAAGNPLDGSHPYSALTQGPGGVLFGTTDLGGQNAEGTAFSITTNGLFNVLHSFTGSTEGANPYAGLVLGSDGNLYGAAAAGTTNGDGALFQLRTNGTPTGLHSFTFLGDGGDPRGGLIQGRDGNYWGMTSGGGFPGGGTIFRITPSGSFSNLYSFVGGADGATPYDALLQGRGNYYYGTASAGGAYGLGTVFRLYAIPPAPVFQKVSRTNGLVNLVWSSVSGQIYQMQYSTNLARTNWTNLGNPTPATNTTMSASDLIGTNHQRFYRVVLLP